MVTRQTDHGGLSSRTISSDSAVLDEGQVDLTPMSATPLEPAPPASSIAKTKSSKNRKRKEARAHVVVTTVPVERRGSAQEVNVR